MRRAMIILTLAAGLVLAGTALAGKKLTVAGTPPVVVKTVPTAGDVAVDPASKEIRVTFSKKMMTKNMWSFVQVSKDSFPRTTGKARYAADGKTIVLPVKLESGKTYAMWLNKGKMNAFRCKGGIPAVPYLLVFQTK